MSHYSTKLWDYLDALHRRDIEPGWDGPSYASILDDPIMREIIDLAATCEVLSADWDDTSRSPEARALLVDWHDVASA